jgi:hypothetical protein
VKVSETFVKCSILKLHYTLYTKKRKYHSVFKERRRKMKRNKTLRIVTILTLALFALSLLSTVQLANAYTFPRSVDVALVPGPTCINGGALYIGSSWPDSLDFNFTNLSPVTIADENVDDPLTDFDTVMIMAPQLGYYGNPTWATLWADTDFNTRITDFVNGGGKLIIYVSEISSSYYSAFSDFLIPFTIVNPGQTGSSGGTIDNIEDDTLSSSDAVADTYPSGNGSYIDLSRLTSSTDAVGDASVMTTVDPGWYIDMTAINIAQDGGPVHTYGFYGDGLIIFNGLDIDYGSQSYPPSNAAGRNAIQMVWWRELCGQELGAGQSVSGLTLTPPTATNAVGTTHTVTATVKDSINNPVSGVVVNFTIVSGPNVGMVGADTTDTNGEATFSWSSAAEGTDTVEAAINGAIGAAPITTTATKTWYITPNNVIPEVPLGTLAAFAVMFVGLASFAAKGKIHKSPKLQK